MEASPSARPYLQVVLPYPPTVNHLYLRGRRGVRKSDQGKQFEADVRQIIAHLNDAVEIWPLDPFKTWPGRYKLTIKVYPPDKRRRDLDNIVKATQDAVCGAVGIDDCKIDALEVYRHPEPSKDEPRVSIRLEGWHV